MLRFPDTVPATHSKGAAMRSEPTRHTVRWMLGTGHANTATHAWPTRPQPAELRDQEPSPLLEARHGELLDKIYATVEDRDQWPVVLDGISELVGADQTFLLTDGCDTEIPCAIASHGSDPEALKLFVEYYASINVFAEPADRVFRATETRFSHWVVKDADLERTEFYQDFLRRFGMYYSFGVKVSTTEEKSLYLSCQRSRSRSAFTQTEGRLLQSLQTHLERAFRLQQRAAVTRCEVEGLRASVDAFGHVLFGLDRTGRVIFSTEQARQAARMASVLEVRDERLRCVLHGQGELIQQLLEAVKGSEGKLASRTLFKADGERVQMMASSLRHGGTDSQNAVLLYVYDATLPPPTRTRLLVDLYRLTPIEARLCQSLLCGLSVQDASDQLRITPATCRFHLKSIFTKTGVRRQPELMLMLSSLPAV